LVALKLLYLDISALTGKGRVPKVNCGSFRFRQARRAGAGCRSEPEERLTDLKGSVSAVPASDREALLERIFNEADIVLGIIEGTKPDNPTL
jgi:hypothetical protein